MSSYDKITFHQNFICTVNERWEYLQKIVRQYGKVFGDHQFEVLYNTNTRANEVKILYNRHLPKLNFYLMLEEDWALNTLALLKTIDTKWVVNKAEDYMVTMEKEDWTNIIDEVVNNDIDYCNLTKVNEYGARKYGGYEEGDYGYFYKGVNSPTKSMSGTAIYKVDLWIERLEYFIANRDKPGVREAIPYPYWTLPNSIEGFFSRIAPMNSDPVLKEWNCYVPKHNLFYHWETDFDDPTKVRQKSKFKQVGY
jgi:hypothetical protein|tara:strand:- start:1241 stop:1996 length:756 start_codon:yes stop_codon:yes gene_type:complete